ncbi:hypothetical protein ACROYT_G025194 [Oculina patagonica]
MAGAVQRASLLVQMLFYHVKFNILQKAGQWILTHTQRKTKVQKLTKKLSVEDAEFFDIGTSLVEEPSANFDRCENGKEDKFTYHSEEPVGKSFSKKKKKHRFRRNKVTPSRSNVCDENRDSTDEANLLPFTASYPQDIYWFTSTMNSNAFD